MIPVAGGTPVDLTNHSALDGSSASSPDGQRIAFARIGAVRWSVPDQRRWRRRLAPRRQSRGRRPTRVGAGWVPRRLQLFDREWRWRHLHSDCGWLHGDAARHDAAARLGCAGPDESTIAFATERYDTVTLSGDGSSWFLGAEIALMNPDGSGVRALDSGPAEYPAWSPDGARIAF